MNSTFTERKKAALSALTFAQKFVESVKDEPPALPASERAAVEASASQLVVGLLYDHYVPVSLFRAWASAQRFREWRDDPRVALDVVIRHGRCCVKPSAFFALWEKLPADRKRRVMQQVASNFNGPGKTRAHTETQTEKEPR